MHVFMCCTDSCVVAGWVFDIVRWGQEAHMAIDETMMEAFQFQESHKCICFGGVWAAWPWLSLLYGHVCVVLSERGANLFYGDIFQQSILWPSGAPSTSSEGSWTPKPTPKPEDVLGALGFMRH